jgi:sugar lactone lactonase YvrE
LNLIRLRGLLVIFPILLLVSSGFAEGTRTWEQSKFEELIKGTTKGVAVRSAGGLELAPAFTALSTTPSTYIWSIAADREGNLYAASGSPARVYRITPDGKSAVIFEPQELQVQALVVDPSGAVYAATNPDGKIYKIEHHAASANQGSKDKNSEAKPAADSPWSSSVYFEPGTKYIWDLALDDAGDLYVATGDHGEIFRVTPKGEHSVFFKSDEAHIRVMAFDSKGNLIAGSDGSGLVYRISPSGEGFVLYSAPKKEITALSIDKTDTIYAAGVGEKHGGSGSPSFPSAPVSIPTSPSPSSMGPQSGIVITASPSSTSTPSISFPGPGSGAAGGSEIYRIAPDGSPSRLWSSHEDIVYALTFDQHGRLLAGTGNRGRVFAISAQDEFTDLIKASATQVTAFANAPHGGLYASTSNLGKVFLLSATPESEGEYESDVFDAHIFSRWGRAEFRGAGNVDLFARSGNVDNPDRNWSKWEQIDLRKNTPASVPPARFLQWKAVLRSGDPPPRVESVTFNYLPKNVAPDFDDVTVQVGVRYQALPKPAGVELGSVTSQQPHFDAPPPVTHDRESIAVKWAIHDDNDDQMIYSVYYRGDGDSRWLLLKDNLTDKFYSFDASLLPDGGYTIKVVASDAPSHSPGQALSAEKESARFEVDTTPPQIENLAASVEDDKIRIAFRAKDSFSNIRRADYSIDAGEWQFVEPVGQLSDSKTESYDFRVAVPAANSGSTTAKAAAGQAEHVVVVRVYDRYDNMNSAKTVIRGK